MMMSAEPQGDYFRFSSAHLPPQDRLAFWREEFGRQAIRLDMEQIDDVPLYYDSHFRFLDGVTIGLGTVSAISCTRSRELLQDANNDIILLIVRDGELEVTQHGHAETLQPGDALVRRSDDIGTTKSRSGSYLTLTLPEAALTPRLADIDKLSFTVLRGESDALYLLNGYAGQLVLPDDVGHLPNGAAARLAKDHLLDLAALSIGVARNEWESIRAGGQSAARIRAIRTAIRQQAYDNKLTASDIARQVNISDGFMRKLLATEGTNFSRLVMGERLSFAFNRLSDPCFATSPITATAFEAGFNDLSYFNRSFRKHLGLSPSAFRALSQEEGSEAAGVLGDLRRYLDEMLD